MHYFTSILLVSLSLCASVSAAPADHLKKRLSSCRTSTPSGCLTVRASGAGTGEYSTLSAAYASLGTGNSTSSACIFLYPGTYHEQVKIKAYKGSLIVYGSTTNVRSYTSNSVVITQNSSASATSAGNDENSSTVDIAAANVSLYNIDVVNTFGKGVQAVALTGNADKLGFYGCSFKGYQDTLYAKYGYQYYSNCYIEGAVDYIFGSANAWFSECTIASVGTGSITAQDRETDAENSWYVIDHSKVIQSAAAATSLAGEIYLGRPWGHEARVIYQYSSISNIINAAGWTTFTANATPTFEEYQNTGDGSSTVSRLYETAATAAVSMSQLWPNGYSWLDSRY